jgi:hypothetical protein
VALGYRAPFDDTDAGFDPATDAVAYPVWVSENLASLAFSTGQFAR